MRFAAPTATVLGWSRMLGLDVTTAAPEPTMAPDVPAVVELVPRHEKSLAAAREQVGRPAAAFAGRAA
ncbi:hypothetical protein B4N89_01365 [Embleya scabrispora]|uniref:Uncharacterized protein n=2 Tax=Embleya scabrispora TaxID=159449 RepID=A0A1T3NS77_9ACTN|nr:hypothetical protein B4N89_01365 [Embleya scabrispora]